MKLVPVVLAASALLGVLGGLLGSRLLVTDDEDGMDPGVEERLVRISERLDALEADRHGAARRRAGSSAAAIADNREAIALLDERLRSLSSRLNADSATSRTNADERRLPEDPDRLTDLVEERLRIIEEERDRARRETAAQENARRIAIDARKRVATLATRLGLAESQQRDLARIQAEVLEAEYPHYGTLKGGESPAARLEAIRGIRAGWQRLDEQARSLMSFDQYRTYSEIQTEERAKISGWLDETEAQLTDSER